MQDVTSAHSKSFPSPQPRLGAKQSKAFIRGESQISPAKDNLWLTKFMGEKNPNSPPRPDFSWILKYLQQNLDGGMIKPTPALYLPFIPQPHQGILIFIGLQVSLPALKKKKKRTKGPSHQDDNEGCVLSSAKTLLTWSGALLFLACVCCNIYRSWEMKPHFTAK